MNWHAPEITELVSLALREDHAADDITTRTLIGPRWRVRADIRAKQAGVVAGLPLAEKFFKALDPHGRFKARFREGAIVRSGAQLAVIEGNARAILSAERPALNALQHLSGIATLTNRLVRRIRSRRTRLYDTRKTLPGWRKLEKYAVSCGGGTNHRRSLADAVLIKDNHLRICRLAHHPWLADVQRLTKSRPALPVQLEIQTRRDLREALLLKPGRVLLDNMPARKLHSVISILRKKLPRTEIEVSGGVTPDDLPRLSLLGVERISMGKITHSAPAFDCHLNILHVDAR